MSDKFITVLIIIIGIAIVVLLIWKNNKDKKLLNPDAGDATDEALTDQNRRRDKL